jgi:hypothetical protein
MEEIKVKAAYDYWKKEAIKATVEHIPTTFEEVKKDPDLYITFEIMAKYKKACK